MNLNRYGVVLGFDAGILGLFREGFVLEWVVLFKFILLPGFSQPVQSSSRAYLLWNTSLWFFNFFFQSQKVAL